MYYTFSQLKRIANILFSDNDKIVGQVTANGKRMQVTRKSAEEMELENPTLNVINGRITSFSN